MKKTGVFKILVILAYFSWRPSTSTIFHTKKCNRDIYLILLDMYPGKNTLDSFDVDNSAFYNSLRERKFKV